MVLTFGVISNKSMLHSGMLLHAFSFGYTMLLFVEDYLNKLQRNEGSSVRVERKTIKSSTVQYARLLDFFTKKLKLCSWLQIKGVMNHTFVADFSFFCFLK